MFSGEERNACPNKQDAWCLKVKQCHIWASRGSSVVTTTRLMATNPERMARSQEVGKIIRLSSNASRSTLWPT